MFVRLSILLDLAVQTFSFPFSAPVYEYTTSESCLFFPSLGLLQNNVAISVIILNSWDAREHIFFLDAPQSRNAGSPDVYSRNASRYCQPSSPSHSTILSPAVSRSSSFSSQHLVVLVFKFCHPCIVLFCICLITKEVGYVSGHLDIGFCEVLVLVFLDISLSGCLFPTDFFFFFQILFIFWL